MSAKIWNDIKTAVGETRPDLAAEFNVCRDSPSIFAFLEKHFPIEKSVKGGWESQLLTRTPDMIRAMKK